MIYRNQITSTTYRNETVNILYRAVIERPTISAQEGIGDRVDTKIETVVTDDGEVLVPYGQEPESYVEKNRFYNEIQSDVQDQFS